MADATTSAAGTVTRRSGPSRLAAVGHWLLRPAIEPVPEALAAAMTGVRLLVGVMWLYNLYWKVPPGFGQADGSGLFEFTNYALSYPVFPPFSWVVEHVVLPQFAAFGWVVLAVETIVAVSMLSGSFVRIGAALGIAQSVAIGLSVARAPEEWPWSYALMIALHLLLLLGGAGRYLAVDGLRERRSGGVSLGRFWGVLSVAMGVAVLALSATSDPFGPRGVNLQVADLEFGVGSYNLIGGVVLLLVGVALLLWSPGPGRGWLAWLAAAPAGAAAVLLTVQVGFSPPALGGSATSAAFFVTLTVVAVALGRSAHVDSPTTSSPRKY